MCDITTAAVVAGGAILGGVAASSSRPKASANTQTQTTNSEPWAPQGIRLESNYVLAEDLKAQQWNRGPWQGDLSPDMDPLRRQALDGSAAFANGQGAAIAGQANNAAGTLISAAPGFVDRAGALATTGTGGMNATAQNTLTAAASGAPLADASRATGALDAALATSRGLAPTGDPAQRALTTGGQFADSDVVRQQIDNAALDVARNFNENTAPGLNARASAGGNLNSARAGIAEGLARRDAGEAVGRIAATMRGNAFNQGVSASLEGNSQNNALALGANAQTLQGANLAENMRGTDISTRMAGATGLSSQDLAARGLDVNTRLAANAQAGEAAFRGFDAAQSAGALFDANTGRLINTGSANEAEAARVAEEDFQNYMRDYNFRQGLIADSMGVLTAGGVQAGTSTSTIMGPRPQSPNFLQGALGGAMMGAGMSPYFRSTPSVGGTPKNF